MTAGKEAAISRESCQARRMVSTKTWTVMKLWLTIRGAARGGSSRLPPGVGEGGEEVGWGRRVSVGVRDNSAGSSLFTRNLLVARRAAPDFMKTGRGGRGFALCVSCMLWTAAIHRRFGLFFRLSRRKRKD